jgi:hypothetical protein
MMRTRIYAVLLALAGLALAAVATAVLAENVDPNNDGSQYAWSENRGWLNAEPAGCGGCGVHVTNSGLSGYLWGENIGWVNLSCGNNNACSGPAGSWGVSNDGAGVLSGYGWAENAGWINFSCRTNFGPGCAGSPVGNWGVTIDAGTGSFSGYAWGENMGWISFSDTAPVVYKVQTSDHDGDSVFAGSDNCPAVANAGQANADGDTFGDACDACPATGNPASCADDDNDGYTDADEGLIGTNPAYSCGIAGWPSNLVDPGSGFPTNAVDIFDVTSFIGPVRRLDTDLGAYSDNNRWDLIPGPGVFVNDVNIADLTALFNGAPGSGAYPPMFGGQRAWERECPLPP